jgi:hypothetical protein
MNIVNGNTVKSPKNKKVELKLSAVVYYYTVVAFL